MGDDNHYGYIDDRVVNSGSNLLDDEHYLKLSKLSFLECVRYAKISSENHMAVQNYTDKGRILSNEGSSCQLLDAIQLYPIDQSIIHEIELTTNAEVCPKHFKDVKAATKLVYLLVGWNIKTIKKAKFEMCYMDQWFHNLAAIASETLKELTLLTTLGGIDPFKLLEYVIVTYPELESIRIEERWDRSETCGHYGPSELGFSTLNPSPTEGNYGPACLLFHEPIESVQHTKLTDLHIKLYHMPRYSRLRNMFMSTPNLRNLTIFRRKNDDKFLSKLNSILLSPCRHLESITLYNDFGDYYKFAYSFDWSDNEREKFLKWIEQEMLTRTNTFTMINSNTGRTFQIIDRRIRPANTSTDDFHVDSGDILENFHNSLVSMDLYDPFDAELLDMHELDFPKLERVTFTADYRKQQLKQDNPFAYFGSELFQRMQNVRRVKLSGITVSNELIERMIEAMPELETIELDCPFIRVLRLKQNERGRLLKFIDSIRAFFSTTMLQSLDR